MKMNVCIHAKLFVSTLVDVYLKRVYTHIKVYIQTPYVTIRWDRVVVDCIYNTHIQVCIQTSYTQWGRAASSVSTVVDVYLLTRVYTHIQVCIQTPNVCTMGSRCPVCIHTC